MFTVFPIGKVLHYKFWWKAIYISSIGSHLAAIVRLLISQVHSYIHDHWGGVAQILKQLSPSSLKEDKLFPLSIYWFKCNEGVTIVCGNIKKTGEADNGIDMHCISEM